MTAQGQNPAAGGAFAPLVEPTFRRIWTASVLSNFGQLILGVGAAWEMTRLSSSPGMVALVQTAMMLPLMLVALPAGALADMFDRRKIALWGLAFSIMSSTILTVLAVMGMATPWLLLGFCVLIGAGVAIYSPAWQASISEQVSEAHLPAAVALGTISYNVARSFGPALGGVIVLAFGAQAAFGVNAAACLPLWFAFLFWQRRHVPSRLPPERIDRAIISGARYVLHTPRIRSVLVRALAFGLVTATSSALAPLVARDLLRGDADTFGILLGAMGMGAVTGALMVGRLRPRFANEAIVRGCTVVSAAAALLVGLSSETWLTCLGFFLGGGANILAIAVLNVSVQMSAPRWVTARALSLFGSAITGGIAIGAWLWGLVAQASDVSFAFCATSAAIVASLALGWFLPLPRSGEDDVTAVALDGAPEVGLGITMRSGPVVIEVEYRVDPERARDFYQAMIQLQKVRLRNGGFDWSIARDIADPALWTERYHCPTWGDYLRMRDHYTQGDIDVHEVAAAFNESGDAPLVRRRLERPFGSVRWKAESPDPHLGTVGYAGP